mmetsp:Transcript_2393/g.7259  ORF Transcript_2393/g.7259 Transcript_2393/m.7259 type:complete len:209 (+) Transcript_2393:1-627(+)
MIMTAFKNPLEAKEWERTPSALLQLGNLRENLLDLLRVGLGLLQEREEAGVGASGAGNVPQGLLEQHRARRLALERRLRRQQGLQLLRQLLHASQRLLLGVALLLGPLLELETLLLRGLEQRHGVALRVVQGAAHGGADGRHHVAQRLNLLLQARDAAAALRERLLHHLNLALRGVPLLLCLLERGFLLGRWRHWRCRVCLRGSRRHR